MHDLARLTEALGDALQDDTPVEVGEIVRAPAEVIPTVVVLPEVDRVLNEGTRVLRDQVRRYAEKGPLNPQEVRAMTQMMDTLAKLVRVDLERRKHEEAGSWTLDELWAFVDQAERQGLRPKKEG